MAVSESSPEEPDRSASSPQLAQADEVQIANLIYAVAEYRDRGDWNSAARLFEHATFETHYPAGYPGVGVPPDKVSARQPGSPGRQQGVEETAALFKSTSQVYGDGLPQTHYVTTNLIIEVDGDTAEARSYYLILQAVADFPLQAISAGRYRDRFTREQGVWRFASRTIFADHSGDLSHHLAMDPLAYRKQSAREKQ